LGTAAAAVMAGLAGCNSGSSGSSSSGSSSAAGFSGNTAYFKSDYEYTEDGEKKLQQDQHDLYKQLVGEGSVLLKNEGNALPISTGDGTINVFGNAGPQYIAMLDEAFKEAGFQFNDKLWEFYANGTTNVTNWAVNENPWADVEASGALNGASGVAIVVLGRRGREASDNRHDVDNDYLAISAEEEQMLDGVAKLRRDGTFSKMIVLFNTTNTISWKDADWQDAIDAILWCGSYYDPYFSAHEREWAVDPLVGVLKGDFNPSGRMPDSIYKNNQDNPVMVNFGSIDADLSRLSDGKDTEVQRQIDEWKPSNDKGSHWRRNYVYVEGIYVGYRYYETRYEDKVLGAPNVGDFDYSSYVAYPFGYGLSYSTFEYSDFTATENDDNFEVSVKVTNTGSVEGKHAVTVYAQSPYTAYDETNSVEKPAVQLVAYEKTDAIAAGASAVVKLTVKKSDLASYDSNAAKTYILEAGTYYLTVGNGSHEAINNILAAKGKGTADGMTAAGEAALTFSWENLATEDKAFSTSAAGKTITNLFDDVDPNKNATMKELNSVVWTTRSNWEGTLPKEAIHLVYTDEVADMAKPIAYKAGSGDPSSVPTHEFGKTDGGVMLVDMYQKDYDDPDWDKVVSALTYEEMVSLLCDDAEVELPSIGKSATSNADGSNGRSTTFAVSGLTGIPYPMTAWRTAAFNKELSAKVGSMIGENELHASTVDSKALGLYGFSCNNHRSPYSGRNYEYYSEDPFLAGTAISNEIANFVAKGGVTFMKHFAGNDQETYRHGVPSWANEQTLREIYLKPFAMAMVDGHANGIMSGFNRLGMWWTGASPALLREFAEGEQGYRGITLTDAFETDFMDTVDGILNGTHCWLGGAGYKNTDELLLQDDYKSDPVIQDAVYNVVHRILYVQANSLTINGLTHDSKVGGTESGDSGEVREAMLTGNCVIDETVEFYPASCTTSFYDDGTFAFTYIQMGTVPMSGKWTYDDKSGLAMTLDDGTAMEVTEKDGVYHWTFTMAMLAILGPRTAEGTISKYELVTAANSAMGKNYAVPEQLSYKLTYTNENAAATGTDIAATTVCPGDTFTLPECPYSGQFLLFRGWDVFGETMEAGAEVKVTRYEDYAITASWADEVLVKGEAQDSYMYSFVQDDTVPLTLYCNGKAYLDGLNATSNSGTWEVAGSGAAATLTLKNEVGAPVGLTIEGDAITYKQSAIYYDWGQPDVGYGSGLFYTVYTHRIPVADFLAAYNKTFGTAYETLAATTGAAVFAEQEDLSVASKKSPW
ncbi:glycoside hydrolase family 3 C-terminal domain-containing protein, partial [Paratractidigestivibacter sp.]|uniref:glycoside hydrolase family 3 C-terminal domain-containing protein n=1 Tax=Paratractidigestivibacter sp. TaxID=2847316 RepID=UPI002ACB1842